MQCSAQNTTDVVRLLGKIKKHFAFHKVFPVPYIVKEDFKIKTMNNISKIGDTVENKYKKCTGSSCHRPSRVKAIQDVRFIGLHCRGALAVRL